MMYIATVPGQCWEIWDAFHLRRGADGAGPDRKMVRVRALESRARYSDAGEDVEWRLRARGGDHHTANDLPEDVFADGPVHRSLDDVWAQQPGVRVRSGRDDGDRGRGAGR